MERLGTGWMGAILELEGVLLEWPDYGNLGLHAWEQLAQELGKPPPPKWALRRAEGMKNEQVRGGGGGGAGAGLVGMGYDGFCGSVYFWWWGGVCGCGGGDVGSGRGARTRGHAGETGACRLRLSAEAGCGLRVPLLWWARSTLLHCVVGRAGLSPLCTGGQMVCRAEGFFAPAPQQPGAPEQGGGS